MSISNYSELKTAVSDWMARGDISGNAADFVTLAEARLNRELPAVVSDVSLTGTQGSRRIDITAHKCVEPIRLFLAPAAGGETEITKKQDGDFPYTIDTGMPAFWASDENNTAIDFDCLLSEAFAFRFRCRQQFALSDSSPTNWLLTNHPDVYLMACQVWGGAFIKDFAYASTFKGALEEAMAEVKNIISKQNKGSLTVDPALALIGRRRLYTERYW
jgi:hypothetical protein